MNTELLQESDEMNSEFSTLPDVEQRSMQEAGRSLFVEVTQVREEVASLRKAILALIELLKSTRDSGERAA